MNSLSIGEVARQSGLGIETVRFYEREGLLAKPSRKASGYRQYDENAVRLLFTAIMCAALLICRGRD